MKTAIEIMRKRDIRIINRLYPISNQDKKKLLRILDIIYKNIKL